MKKCLIISIILLILCLITLGIVTKLSENESLNSNENNTTTDEPASPNNIPFSLDINSEFVQNLYKMASPSSDAGVLKDLYDDGIPSNTYILATGAMNYIRKNIPVDSEMIQNHMFTTTITKEDLKQHIEEVFGSINYQDEDFYVLNYEYGVCGFTYQEELERYESLNGCGGSMFESFKRKLISAREEDNYFYITEKSIYIYNDWDDYISRRYIYSDYNQEKMLDYIETSSNESLTITVDDYLGEAMTYDYVFEKNNDRYIFKGLQKNSN